jgi:hypothetical protein
MISKRLTSRRTHSYQHNLGVALKISLAEATYAIQDSQIGDWELAYLISSASVETETARR